MRKHVAAVRVKIAIAGNGTRAKKSQYEGAKYSATPELLPRLSAADPPCKPLAGSSRSALGSFHFEACAPAAH
jgi:hypothetical protein